MITIKNKLLVLLLVVSMFATTGFSLKSSLSANGAAAASVASGVEQASPQSFKQSEPLAVACVGAVARSVAKVATKATVYAREALKAYGDELDRVMRDASMYVGGIASGNEEAVEEIFDIH